MNFLKQKILIVEDSKIDMDILCSILGHEIDNPVENENSEYSIITAVNGKEALERAKKENPDIILMDIMMPEMDGFETICKLKESENTRIIPVIFITSLDSAEEEEKGINLGAVDYIIKPFRPTVVKAKVKRHLEIAGIINTFSKIGFTDALTGIPNRRFFDERMIVEWSHALRESISISLLMIDIDCFKLVNDTYGHQQGDLVLQAVAQTLKPVLQRSTDIFARWGGEEFAVFLPSTKKEGAMEIAEKIRKSVEVLSIPYLDKKGRLSVTVSIGVACVKPTSEDFIVDLVRQVDIALYEAKNTGRNKVCFYKDTTID